MFLLVIIGLILLIEGWVHERVDILYLKKIIFFEMAFSLALKH